MRLVLKSPTSHKDEVFDRIIKKELLRYVKLNLTDNQRKKWNSYLKDHLHINKWSIDRLLIYTIQTLKSTIITDDYIVYLDKDYKLPDTTYSLDTLVRLIDYGNLDIKGTHLMNDACAYIKENIGDIVLEMMGY